MKNSFKTQTELEKNVRKRVEEIKNFYTHLFIFCIGMAIYLGKTYFGISINFFPVKFINETVMFFWTIAISIQGIALLLKEKVLGKNWEQRKIQQLMDKEKSENTKWE